MSKKNVAQGTCSLLSLPGVHHIEVLFWICEDLQMHLGAHILPSVGLVMGMMML